MIRVRSHFYPDSKEYTDTTYYDDTEQYLDLGYQRLKKLSVSSYPEFFFIKKLFINHNNLESLPDQKYLPLLEELDCSNNKLTNIPFYSKLINLKVSKNNITQLSQYHHSLLRIIDVSNNSNLVIDFCLPHCKEFYAMNCELTFINKDFIPCVQILDLENNKINVVPVVLSITELNIQKNYVTEIPFLPQLSVLMADYNLIKTIKTYPNLVFLQVSFNHIVEISAQPLLKKIIANNNKISDFGMCPKLEVIDLSHNKLSKFVMPHNSKYISLQFNKLTELFFNENSLKNLHELQISYDIYASIYKTYSKHFDLIDIQMNWELLHQLLEKLKNILNDSMIELITQKYHKINFANRDEDLFKITLIIYYKYFGKFNLKNIKNNVKFNYLLENFTKIYYKTIVVTIYFNGFYVHRKD